MQEELHDESSTPPIYQFKPKGWLRRIHATADIGYAGLFPPHPGQEEDVLSVRAIKHGFATESRVSAEAFSAKAAIEGFHSEEVFTKLEEMMTEVFARRADRLPPIPPSTFRLPTRVTLNDAKRRAWFRDLANPDVPLHKLGKSVPHGAKGHDLLDLLHTNNVAIPRAVWFLRVFGANEVAGLRNKPSYNPTQYSIDWANVVTGYMKKQLLDIALPSPPRAGLNIKQIFKGVLTDNESRERWVSRLNLLRYFYVDGLVDKRTFLVWLVQQMSTCNLAQIGFVAHLADEYLSDITESRALSRCFSEACLNRLHEIQSGGPAQACLMNTNNLIRSLTQRVCLSAVEAFISPRLWASYSTILRDTLTGEVVQYMGNQHIEQSKIAIQTQLLDRLTLIQIRNEAMLLQGLPTQTPALLGSAVSDVKLLNSISHKTNLEEIVFFGCGLDDVDTFARKIDTLFTWSVSLSQYGYHRPFAAVSLLSMWQAKFSERAHRRDLMSPREFLQDRLFDWLDLSGTARVEENLSAITLLYGNLIAQGSFCYAAYVRRLVARGEPGLLLMEKSGSHHRNFIRHIPLLDSNSSLINQRRVLLYGVRAREVPEEMNERQIRREVRGTLPTLFGGDNYHYNLLGSTLASSCNTFVTSSRFEQVRILRQWLLPILQAYVTNQQSESESLNFLQIYALSVEMMTLSRSFDCMMDLLITILRCALSIDVVMAVVDQLHHYADTWLCMGGLGNLVVELDAAHQALKARGHQSRLPFDLIELDGGRYLTPASRERINSDIEHFTTALRPIAVHPEHVPDVLPEIFRLESDFNPDFPSRLANSLWIKYRTSSEWGWRVWENALASLEHVADGESSTGMIHQHALPYGMFLWHIDQHLAAGLDSEVLHWLTGPGSSQITKFSPAMWDMLSIVLIYLVAHRALHITTIMTGLVFPAWKYGASITTEDPHRKTCIITYVQTANKLCEALLSRCSHGDHLMLLNLHHGQCIESRRQMVYSEPFFSTFIPQIPFLIHLENHVDIPEQVRLQTGQLRFKLCQEDLFRQGAFRNLDGTREAFENFLVLNDDMGEILINRLKHCLSGEGSEAGQWFPSGHQFFSPWELAATSIHLQLMLKELGRALSREITREHATVSLEKVSQELFNHRITQEGAYYLGEVTRSVDRVVVGKLVASGLRRVVEILVSPASLEEGPECNLHWANEVLRAILYMAGPSDNETAPIPGLEPFLHELLLGAVHKKFNAINRIISSEYDADAMIPAIVILLRILQFTLGHRGTWSTKAKDEGISISTILFRFVLKMSRGSEPEISIYPLILDTLYYLLDELPCDTKIAFDPFRNYPEFTISDVPTDIPPDHRRQIMALATQVSPCASVSDLVMSIRDNHNEATLSNPVVNRPWEWMEHLGDPGVDVKEQHRDDEANEHLRHALKNAGAISLEMFGAKITGDYIIPNLADGQLESHVRAFEDGLSADTLFRRDWRESRIDIGEGSSIIIARKPTGEHESEMGTKNQRSTVEHHTPDHVSGTRIVDSTSGEMVDPESNSTTSIKTSKSKRKLDAMSDDDVEATEGPTLFAKKGMGKRP
ncbi:hypothetical protein APHAL10511_000137 [Amanita phalloides]|nr:hypothetical protein APHAL10511_000137 [Amanita phalloides]